MLLVSNFVDYVQLKNNMWYVYNSMKGLGFVCSAELLELIKKADSKQLSRLNSNIISKLKKYGIVINSKEDPVSYVDVWAKKMIPATLGKTLKGIVFMLTNKCNYCCTHCAAGSNGRLMGEALDIGFMKEVIYDFLRFTGEKNVNIVFTGGEPLLEIKLISEFCAFCVTISQVTFSFTIITNGSLLNKFSCSIIERFNIKIELSLDGLQKTNDMNRQLNFKGSASDKTIQGIKNLKENTNKSLRRITYTITKKNGLPTREFIDFVTKLKVPDLYIQNDVYDITYPNITSCIDSMMNLYMYCKNKSINIVWDWGQPFHNMMAINTDSEDATFAFCPTQNFKNLIISTSGNLLPCDYSLEQYTYIGIPSIKKYITQRCKKYLDSYDSRNECKKCPIFCYCFGGCILKTKNDMIQSDHCKLLKQGFKVMTREFLCYLIH